jgi:replicative DNA helicase
MTDAELGLLGHLVAERCTVARDAIRYTTDDPYLASVVVGLAHKVLGRGARLHVHAERGRIEIDLPGDDARTAGRPNSLAAWLEDVGVSGLDSHEKRVPERVFEQPADGIAIFLRQLWATDGQSWSPPVGDEPAVRFDARSEALSRDVASLLLRLGITAAVQRVPTSATGRAVQRVLVTGRPDVERFAALVGDLGSLRAREAGPLRPRTTPSDATGRAPDALRTLVAPSAPAAAATGGLQSSLGAGPSSALDARLSGRDAGASVSTHNGRAHAPVTSDIYWDELVSLEPDGEEDVYDLTVDELPSFVAEDGVVHNSIEQDSDIVVFVYRDDYYNEQSEQQGLAELIVAKHRNGPTDTVKLSFLKRYAKFADLAAQ